MVDKVKSKSKFKNIRVEFEGMKFDSKGELARFIELRNLASAGEISSLKRQVRYELAPHVFLNGKKKPALAFWADFVYYDKWGNEIVEDFKGKITTAYRIKKHLMKHVHGVDIIESK